MSWGHGELTRSDGTTIEVGYLVDDVCNLEGCDQPIGRGISYRCGYVDFDRGCGRYFCEAHLFMTPGLAGGGLFMCAPCCDAAPRPRVLIRDHRKDQRWTSTV